MSVHVCMCLHWLDFWMVGIIDSAFRSLDPFHMGISSINGAEDLETSQCRTGVGVFCEYRQEGAGGSSRPQKPCMKSLDCLLFRVMVFV